MSKEKKFWKSKNHRRIFIVASAVIAYYILLILIPIMVSQQVQLGNSSQFLERDNGRFLVHVEKGKKYAVSVNTFSIWEEGMNIRLYQGVFHVKGTRIDTATSGYEQIYFTSNHNGYYYAVVGFKSDGYYDFIFYEIDYVFSGLNNLYVRSFINYGNLILSLLPFFACVVVAVLFIAFYKVELEKKGIPDFQTLRKTIKCPSCGLRVLKEANYCKHCGYTFDQPKIPESF